MGGSRSVNWIDVNGDLYWGVANCLDATQTDYLYENHASENGDVTKHEHAAFGRHETADVPALSQPFPGFDRNHLETIGGGRIALLNR
ncbi:MAG: hypothetical protein OHK0019_37720 [Saprospiraceae bacterium]